MNEIALANFYRVLNNEDRFPKEHELAEAAIAAKDELNALYRSPVESVPVAEIEGICAQIHKLRTDGFVNHGSYADKELEAIETRLSAIVKEWGK